MTTAALLVSLLAVCAYSAVLTLRFRAPAGTAPLAVLCAGTVWMCAWGYAGMLIPGGVLWYAGAAAALGYSIRKMKKTGVKQCAARLFTPGFVLFAGASLALCLILSFRRPMFVAWDEFSFWGTASKLTKIHNTLYPAVESNMYGKLAYPPAIPLMSYLAQFLSPAFHDWAAMAGYDLMLCAAFAAVVSSLEGRGRRTGLFAGTLCLLLPLFFEPASVAGGLSFVYRTLLSETFLGALFGGALAVWFAEKEKNAGTALRFALVLTVLCLTKDVGLVLMLAALMIAGIDLLFFERRQFSFIRLHGMAAVAAALVLVLVLAGTAYPGWNRYFGAAVSIDRTAGDGAAGLTMGQIVLTGVQELLGIGRTERFTTILHRMAGAYFTRRVSVFGSGFTTTLVILAVCAAAFFAMKKGRRAKAVSFAVTSLAGLGGIMVFNLFAYVYVFDEASGLGLIDYERYLCFYYFGWMLGALCLLLGQADAPRARFAVPVLTAAVCTLGLVNVPLSRTLLAPGVANSDMRVQVNQRCEEIRSACGEKDVIFLVSQLDDANRWYRYAHELEPLRVLPMLGGTLVAHDDGTWDAPSVTEISPEELSVWLQEKGCTYLYIDHAADYDTQGYTALFTDGLRGFYDDGVRLYRAVTQDGQYRFEPAGKAGVP